LIEIDKFSLFERVEINHRKRDVRIPRVFEVGSDSESNGFSFHHQQEQIPPLTIKPTECKVIRTRAVRLMQNEEMQCYAREK